MSSVDFFRVAATRRPPEYPQYIPALEAFEGDPGVSDAAITSEDGSPTINAFVDMVPSTRVPRRARRVKGFSPSNQVDTDLTSSTVLLLSVQ